MLCIDKNNSWIITHSSSCICYLKHLKQNMQILKSKAEELSAQENDVKTVLNRAELQNGKKPMKALQVWVEHVEKARNEVANIEAGLEDKTPCLFRCILNFYALMKLAKWVVQNTQVVVQLKEKCPLSGGLVIDLPSISGKPLSTTTLVGKTTARKTLVEIWESLMDPEIGRIGIYGVGGVGKTTMMTHIDNWMNENSHPFHYRIRVTVSERADLNKIQDRIANALGLDLSYEEDDVSRAEFLLEALHSRKKFLLILDDMWGSFPLETVGIPEPKRENGCKIVVITQMKEVCTGMGSQKLIKVELLSKEEAWDLFREKAGYNALCSKEVEKTAKLVAEECGRLPLALITVARAMWDQDNIHVWRNALNELKGSPVQIKGEEDEAFPHLKFSYNHLSNDTIRACFLYCALYPQGEKIRVKDLTEHWKVEELIEEVGNREVEIEKGHTILNELKNAYLLEGCAKSREEYVKMHNLVRDFAIDLTKVRPHFIAKAGIGLKEAKIDEWSEETERVSLMRNDIETFEGQPKCTKLSTLLLQGNPLFQNIAPSFFEHMHSLKVLNLSSTKIESLSESVSNLTNLRALILGDCEDLVMVPSLGKLKELRVLDLSCTRIQELPHGMEELVNLKRLDLSSTRNLEMFRAGILPKLSLLEDLEMHQSEWAPSSGSVEIEGRGAGIKEFESLPLLSNLSIHFTDLMDFVSYVKSEKWEMLNSFHLSVKPHTMPTFSPGSYIIELRGCDLTNQASVLLLPKKISNLMIDDCSINRLSELACLSNMTELKECTIRRCRDMKCILYSKENTFPSLETLRIFVLQSLRILCEGCLLPGIFSSLKKLVIIGCPNLRNLFLVDLLQFLQNLEEIIVFDCRGMEEMVGESEHEDDEITETANTASPISLPSLKKLELGELRKLKSICGDRTLICYCLRTIKVEGCPKLRKLSLSVDNLSSNLKELKGKNEWWDALEWDDPNDKLFFQPFLKEL